jgi:hypothetical protein
LSSPSLLQDVLHDAADTRQIVIGFGVLTSTAEVFMHCFGGRSAIVIAELNR